MEPILKLNGGNTVVLCNKCRIIIDYASVFDKINQKYPLLCRDCDWLEMTKLYNNKKD